MGTFEVVVIGGLIVIALTLLMVGNAVTEQTVVISERLLEIQKQFQEQSNLPIYTIDDIHHKISDLPEEIAKDILHGLSYYSEDMGLKYDLKDINRGLESIEKSIDAIDTRILHVLRQRKLDQ